MTLCLSGPRRESVWVLPAVGVTAFPHNYDRKTITVDSKVSLSLSLSLERPLPASIQIPSQHLTILTFCPSQEEPYWRVLGGYAYQASTPGCPIVTLPIGMVDGLPVGVQVVGRAWCDEELLEVCVLPHHILAIVTQMT